MLVEPGVPPTPRSGARVAEGSPCQCSRFPESCEAAGGFPFSPGRRFGRPPRASLFRFGRNGSRDGGWGGKAKTALSQRPAAWELFLGWWGAAFALDSVI